jgi:hypothetical protein
MNAQTKRVFVSPTSVVQGASREWESRQWEGMTEVTDIFLYPQHQQVRFPDQVVTDIFLYPKQHQVRFSGQISIRNSNLTEELVQELWFTRQEIQDFHKEAKQQAKEYREQHSELVQDLDTLVRSFTKEPSLQALFNSPSAQQIMKSLPGTTVRGLERYLHVNIGRYRVRHGRGLLAIQKRCPKKHDAALLEQLIRSRSLCTSRASRALARLLAHGDFLYLAAIIRQELRESNENIVMIE